MQYKFIILFISTVLSLQLLSQEKPGTRSIATWYGPWYQINNPTLPAKTVTTDSYLNAKTVVGGTTILNDATFTSHGDVSVDGSIVSPNKIGVGNSSPNATFDLRIDPLSSNNPGESFLGIGTTSISASSAGAGALRYSTSSKNIEYSNGLTWISLYSQVKKLMITAEKLTAETFINNTPTDVTDWSINGDAESLLYFKSSTGEFTAPRSGNYMISFNFDFTYGPILAGSQVEAWLSVRNTGGVQQSVKKGLISYTAGGNAQAGSQVTFTFVLNEGDIVVPVIWHTLGSTKSLRIIGMDDGSSGFVNLSIVEL